MPWHIARPIAFPWGSSSGRGFSTSTAGGCPEVVDKAGIIVEPQNAVQIRENLLKLIESDELRTRLGLAAAKRVKRFSWDCVAKEYLDCYRTIIEQQKV